MVERHIIDAALAEEAQSQEDVLEGFFSVFMHLLEAIFGSFTDSDSEYSEISREDAAQVDRMSAEEFMRTVGNGRLRELARQYEGVDLENISPVAVSARISSGLGHRDVDHIPGASSEHRGLDIAVPDGTPIYNTMPGVVVRSETQRNRDGSIAGFGHWIEVACIDGTRRRYAHLSEQDVSVGTVVHQGDQLGLSGHSGVGSGPHLHYEWRRPNGSVAEPMIAGVRYRENDRSYVGTTVAAMDRAEVLAQREEILAREQREEASGAAINAANLAYRQRQAQLEGRS